MVKTERCPWCTSDPLYVAYHDQEWGVPVRNERALFERLTLEGMQAGLSWLTILKKRQHMAVRFFGFDPAKLADQGPRAIDSWLTDPGVIRHRGKLEAMVTNATRVIEMDGHFADLVWSFVDGRPRQSGYVQQAEVPATTPESKAMARALKKEGFRFVGPTTCYAFMQSAGLVNDHLIGCDSHERCKELAAAWTG